MKPPLPYLQNGVNDYLPHGAIEILNLIRYTKMLSTMSGIWEVCKIGGFLRCRNQLINICRKSKIFNCFAFFPIKYFFLIYPQLRISLLGILIYFFTYINLFLPSNWFCIFILFRRRSIWGWLWVLCTANVQTAKMNFRLLYMCWG